jgi:hypothetical protein
VSVVSVASAEAIDDLALHRGAVHRAPMRRALLAMACLLAGCGDIRALTAQTIDCPDEELWVSQEVGFGPGEHEWVAKCRHDVYDCRAANSLITCRPRERSGPARSLVVQPPPPPPPAMPPQ